MFKESDFYDWRQKIESDTTKRLFGIKEETSQALQWQKNEDKW